MKPCDRGRGTSVLFIKAAVKVILFIGKTSVGIGSILGRRLVVGFGLQTMPDVLSVDRQMDVESRAQGAYLALFTNTKHCYYLCRHKLYNIHFSVVLSVGI